MLRAMSEQKYDAAVAAAEDENVQAQRVQEAKPAKRGRSAKTANGKAAAVAAAAATTTAAAAASNPTKLPFTDEDGGNVSVLSTWRTERGLRVRAAGWSSEQKASDGSTQTASVGTGPDPYLNGESTITEEVETKTVGVDAMERRSIGIQAPSLEDDSASKSKETYLKEIYKWDASDESTGGGESAGGRGGEVVVAGLTARLACDT